MSFYPSWKSCQLGIQFVSEIPMFHGLLNGLLVRINKYMFFDLQQMFLKILQGDVQNPPGHESRIQIFFCLVNITFNKTCWRNWRSKSPSLPILPKYSGHLPTLLVKSRAGSVPVAESADNRSSLLSWPSPSVSIWRLNQWGFHGIYGGFMIAKLVQVPSGYVKIAIGNGDL